MKRFLVRCLLLAVLAAFIAGCGKKEEEERQSLVLTVAETAEEDRRDTRASSADLDTVNGFRFEDCDEMVYCTGDGVKLRRKPGMDGEVAGYLEKGAYVHRIGKNSNVKRRSSEYQIRLYFTELQSMWKNCSVQWMFLCSQAGLRGLA